MPLQIAVESLCPGLGGSQVIEFSLQPVKQFRRFRLNYNAPEAELFKQEKLAYSEHAFPPQNTILIGHVKLLNLKCHALSISNSTAFL